MITSDTESEPPPYSPPQYSVYLNNIENIIRNRSNQTSSINNNNNNNENNCNNRNYIKTNSIILALIYNLLRLTSLLPSFIGFLYLLLRSASPNELSIPNPSRIEYLASAPWAILTSVHSFQIISSMLQRWQYYYHPISVIIRLLSIQAASFPWIRITLWLTSNPEKPLLAWILIACTTAISSTLARWYISNLSKFNNNVNKKRHLDLNRLLIRTIFPISSLSILTLCFLMYDLYSTRLVIHSLI